MRSLTLCLDATLNAGSTLFLPLIVLAVAACGSAAATPIGSYSQTGSMTVARNFASAELLPDGHVLLAGGRGPDNSALASAELYDPSTGRFSATGSMSVPRMGQTAALLPNGKVLVAGGFGGKAEGIQASAELFDPETGTFSPTGSMTTPRSGATATLLDDGRVLIAGGSNGPNSDVGHLASAELYDPATGTFTATGSMTSQRADHNAVLLADGRVLLSGGTSDTSGSGGMGSAEIYDPRSGRFTATGSMSTGGNGLVSVLLADGRVLFPLRISSEIYDPGTGQFSAGPSIEHGEGTRAAFLLTDGRVLVIGTYMRGALGGGINVYDPVTNSFSPSDGAIIHQPGACTMLQDGRILVAGGWTIPTTDAFIFTFAGS